VAYPIQLPAAGAQARLLWHSSNYNTAELDPPRGRSSLTLLTIVYGVLVVGGTCLLALAGLELVQRLVPATSRQPYNDVAGFIYAALGVIYAVLLALVVIAVWEEYDAASVTVEQEANALAEIFWLAHRLPEPEGPHIQELAQSYAEEVIHKEWPLMEQGQTPLMVQEEGTPAGWTLIDEIRANLQAFQSHQGRRTALRRRTGPGPETGRRKENAPGCSRGGHPRSALGRSDLRGCSGDRLHLPIRSGEHVGAQVDGSHPGGGDRAGTVHHRGHGASLLRRRPYRHRSLRSNTGEIRDQQAQQSPSEVGLHRILGGSSHLPPTWTAGRLVPSGSASRKTS
jgi:hypothetical protein